MVSALACACFARNAAAQTYYYWDGNSTTTGAGTNAQNTGTWGTSVNWNTDPTGGAGGAITAAGPGSGDYAVFTAFDNVPANNPTGGYTVTLNAAQSVLGVIIGPTVYNATYANNDGTLTLAGTGAPGLSIGASGVVLNGSSGDPIFAASLGTITLAADQAWTINNAHVIATNAAVAGNATAGNTRTFTLGNVGQFTNTFSGVMSDGTGGGGLALTLNNTASTSTTGFTAGTWSVTGVANTFTGATTIARGNLQIASIANLGIASSLGAPTTAAGGTISMGSTTFAGSLSYSGSGVMTTNRIVNLAGSTGGASIYNNSGNAANTLTFTTALANNVAGAKTFTLRGSNVGQNTFAGAIADSTAGGLLTLSKQDAGTWVLGGANTYTGGTTIGGGTLSVGAASSLGSNVAGNNVTISGGNLLLSARQTSAPARTSRSTRAASASATLRRACRPSRTTRARPAASTASTTSAQAA